MLKRTINFDNFDGESTSEDFYFNLSQTELIEMELEYESGLAEALQAIVDTQDPKIIYTEFKKLVLACYGEKSADGRRFVKSDEIKLGFSQTAAFDALIIEFFENSTTLAEFIKGAMPKNMQEAIEKATEERNETETPALPATTFVPPPPPVLL